ncbi:MAG: anaerobic ribonucleoside-triphosphate reductase activating protein [Clostridia bacterium]|nr:anaerobic ribonucleoside-triphosphate reductase activating protein [Clostridia bacterium]
MASRLKISGIAMDSIVDGPGLRMAIFTQGCPHHCPGCHNPESHDPAGGRWMDIQDIVRMANPLLSGVTLTGGEPLEQAPACLSLLDALPKTLSVWLYSGYTYEEIRQGGTPQQLALLEAADVLVDGRFEQAHKSLSIPYRGSKNQRVIDLRATRRVGTVCLFSP